MLFTWEEGWHQQQLSILQIGMDVIRCNVMEFHTSCFRWIKIESGIKDEEVR
jgi:hypothetical protein